MDFYQLSAASFADKIQVPRSSISHLLSGRNKPSLDFVLKVIKEFEEVELYWLLNGKGHFPKTDTPSPLVKEDVKSQDENFSNKILSSEASVLPNTSKKIERIVIFFSDGTFKEYQN